MLQLHEDVNFHYEAMRALGTAPFNGADITEIFNIMQNIKSGDFESWYTEWFDLAQRILSTIDEAKENLFSPVTLRNAYFRVSHYIFTADFYLHGNKSDPRISECFRLYKKYFNKANDLLPIPGKHVTIKAEGFEMPGLVFRAAQASATKPRPTLIVGGGFESVMEETYHVFAVAALERGYNVILYEGPGHRTLIETQGKGFIAEWEQAVTPVMDYILANKDSELAFVDTDKIALVGMSMGGYLAARAAAFETRLAAVICIDGVYSMMETCLGIFPEGKDAWEKRDSAEFDRLFEADPSAWSTNRHWFHDDLKFTFCLDSAFEAYKILDKMSLGNGIAQKIRMPAFIGDAAQDLFFKGQPPRVAQAVGENATLQIFGEEQGGQYHCHSGGLVYMSQEVFEWFARIVGH